jgi:hypothetical protein
MLMYPRLEDPRSVGRSFPRIPSLQDAESTTVAYIPVRTLVFFRHMDVLTFF